MTKKSLGRQLRDQKQKELTSAIKNAERPVQVENNLYNDLQKMYQEQNILFIQHNDFIETIKANTETRARVRDQHAFANSLMALHNDLSNLRQRLATIYAKHADKTGSVEVDEYMIALQLVEDYQKLSTHHNDVVLPILEDIAGQMQEAENLLIGELKQLSIQHPEAVEAAFQELREEAAAQEAEMNQNDPALLKAQDPTVITDVVFNETVTQ